MSGANLRPRWEQIRNKPELVKVSDMQAAPTKATPIDADGVILIDSTASNAIKRTLWSAIKSTLKTYFDTLYPSGSGTSTGTNTGDNATNSQYSGLVSNATHTGDVTGSTALTLATVNSNVGTFGSATQASVVTVNAKGLVTAASQSTVTPAIGSVTGLGTGVGTALAIAVGTSGGPVTNGGALGTPSSGTVTNLTGTASININGTVGATTPTTVACTTLTASGTVTTPKVENTASAVTINGNGKVQFQTGGFDRFQVGPGNDFYPSTTNVYNVGGTANRVLGFYGGTLDLTSSAKIGGGSSILKVLSATATLDFGSVAANSFADLTITVTGAAVGDTVSIGVPNGSLLNDISFFGWVSATNTVTVRCSNVSSTTARDPASGTFRATVTQF